MRFSSSEDEDRSTTGAFMEGPHYPNTVSEGGGRTPPTEILAVVEI
jgi:hypothetical protein